MHRDYYPTDKLKLDRQALLNSQRAGPTKIVNYEYDTQFTGAKYRRRELHITNGDGSDGEHMISAAMTWAGLRKFSRTTEP